MVILIFEIDSVVCASARSSATLVLSRLIAGAGSAGAYVGTLTVMGYAVPIKKRPLHLSVITSIIGVAAVAGPLSSWRAVYGFREIALAISLLG